MITCDWTVTVSVQKVVIFCLTCVVSHDKRIGHTRFWAHCIVRCVFLALLKTDVTQSTRKTIHKRSMIPDSWTCTSLHKIHNHNRRNSKVPKFCIWFPQEWKYGKYCLTSLLCSRSCMRNLDFNNFGSRFCDVLRPWHWGYYFNIYVFSHQQTVSFVKYEHTVIIQRNNTLH